MAQALMKYILLNGYKLSALYNVLCDEEFNDYSREDYYQVLKFYHEFCNNYGYETYNLIMDLIKTIRDFSKPTPIMSYFQPIPPPTYKEVKSRIFPPCFYHLIPKNK